MIRGLYSAVSAMIMNANRQKILAHNVANIDVPGFKQIMATMEENIGTYVSNPMSSLNLGEQADALGLLGLGVMSGEDEIDFTPGSLLSTGNSFDLAIQGSAFFHVETPDGERYTRDGRFLLDNESTLVTTEGYRVLDDGGQPITIPSSEFEVFPSGDITVDGNIVARLGLAEFEDPAAALVHYSGNYYTATGNAQEATQSTVLQGVLESSNVNAAQVMAQMVEVSRAYEAAQELVSNQDQLLGKTISSLGNF